jgi:hypothetical protein
LVLKIIDQKELPDYKNTKKIESNLAFYKM